VNSLARNTHTSAGLPAISTRGLELVEKLDEAVRGLPQTVVTTRHLFHAGTYARTVRVPAGTVLNSALMRIATVVIVSGHCTVMLDVGESRTLKGYHVLPASKGRKSVYVMHEDTDITMVFATSATTVEAAEAEFTHEVDRLMSRQMPNEITITGE
jgi:hypothetical protein